MDTALWVLVVAILALFVLPMVGFVVALICLALGLVD